MRAPLRFLPLLACAIVLPTLPTPARTPIAFAPAPAPEAWLHFDAPAWDIAEEGLPFRFTVSLPSGRDPLTRLLFASEARWTFSVGYAKVYDSYDATTGLFRNPGGHAALASVGRQFRWHLPEVAGRLTPQVAIDFGAHLASRRFPADGTNGNFKLITGLEWTWRSADRLTEWSAGLMWLHFSNADLLSRNSGYDGLAFRFGRSL
jgi:hypothetical protein